MLILLRSAVPSYVLLCLVTPNSALLCHELQQRTATNYYFFLFLLFPLFILTPTGPSDSAYQEPGSVRGSATVALLLALEETTRTVGSM
ncbi:hypothetical protein FQN60_002232 [Etheostoma spectabile]|uniref:Uncharacterized protein n=1 Tax=Etheostoma spectabile TaxID=54343 RepID=A0A5J5DC08_9PERO|nr:hypothetical protein FQN60_002232 [Etheostoma spectabile]